MSNICKFPTQHFYSPLTVSCFVMETDVETMKRSTHLKAHRMLLVIRGQGSFFFDGKAFPFCSGKLVLGFEGETFSAAPEKETVYLYIDFGGGRAEELFRRFRIQRENRAFSGYDGLIPLWRDSLSRADRDSIDLASESILLYSFSRLASYTAGVDTVASRMLKITEESFSDPSLSLGGIAKRLSYSSKYISHVFKKTVGVPYSDYLRDLRLKYAISLFNEGLDSVKNVALLSGFADPLYFSSVFKRAVGISPREYVGKLQDDAASGSKHLQRF